MSGLNKFKPGPYPSTSGIGFFKGFGSIKRRSYFFCKRSTDYEHSPRLAAFALKGSAVASFASLTVAVYFCFVLFFCWAVQNQSLILPDGCGGPCSGPPRMPHFETASSNVEHASLLLFISSTCCGSSIHLALASASAQTTRSHCCRCFPLMPQTGFPFEASAQHPYWPF